MPLSPIPRRRALTLVLAPAAAWILGAWPAAAQQQPEAAVPPAAAEKAVEEKPVEAETKISNETPISGPQPAAPVAEEKPSQIGQPYVRERAEREKQERVIQDRRPADRKARQRSATDRSTIRRDRE